QQERVSAEVDVFLARDEAFDDFVDLGMHERLAARNGNHGCAALVDSLKTFFRREFLLQNMRRVLDFSTARAGEIAAEKRLKHQDKRVALAPCKLLLEDVGCDSPRLRNRYRHRDPNKLN